MAYLLLIVEPRGQRDTRPQPEAEALYMEMVQFGEGLAARRMLLASESLRSDSPACEGKSATINCNYAMARLPKRAKWLAGFF